MSFYNRVVLPWLINQACGGSPVAKQRAKIVPRAKGEMLEVGTTLPENYQKTVK